MSVRMKVTRAKTGDRRSHHKLLTPRLSRCSNCGASHVRHGACPSCGMYRGRMVTSVGVASRKRGGKIGAGSKAE